MDNKNYLRALHNNAHARKFVFIFMTICSLFLCSNVYASDYTFNGETVPAVSSATDNFFGVDTVTSILDKLQITYTDTTKVSFTYYVNKYMKYYIENINNTVKAVNVCFTVDANYTNLVMLIGNGTFSDTLNYLCITAISKSTCDKFDGWTYDSNGNIQTYKTSNLDYAIISSNEVTRYNGKPRIYGGRSQVTSNVLNYPKVVAPLKTYTIASYTAETGYSYYFLDNIYEFSKSGDSNGDTSGDSSGDKSDLAMTNELITKINAQVEEINKKIPTSGDIQQATTAGVTSGLTNYFGGSGDANFEDKKYTSGEILEKIDFKPIENPNANFWFELTNIINNALTGSGGQVIFKWFGKEFKITPNQIVPPYPNELQVLLTTVSTVVVILIIAKWIKIIADTSQEGNLDQLLEMNEEGIVNLF